MFVGIFSQCALTLQMAHSSDSDNDLEQRHKTDKFKGHDPRESMNATGSLDHARTRIHSLIDEAFEMMDQGNRSVNPNC